MENKQVVYLVYNEERCSLKDFLGDISVFSTKEAAEDYCKYWKEHGFSFYTYIPLLLNE